MLNFSKTQKLSYEKKTKKKNKDEYSIKGNKIIGGLV